MISTWRTLRTLLCLKQTKYIQAVKHNSDRRTDIAQIRAKRLAKLGGSASATPNQAPSPTGSPAPTSSNQNAVPSPPAGSTSTSATPVSNGADSTQQTSKPSAPQMNVQPRTVSPVKRERDGSQRPKPAAAGKGPESLESWQDKMLRQVFRTTLNPEETRDLHGHSLIYLASTRDDLVEQSAPLQLNIDVVEAAIAEAASQAPGGRLLNTCSLASSACRALPDKRNTQAPRTRSTRSWPRHADSV